MGRIRGNRKMNKEINNNLVLGVFQHYNFEKLIPWINSLKSCGFNGDKVLLGIGIEDSLCKQINDTGVYCESVEDLKRKPNIQRFKHIENFLKKSKTYKYVLTTDVADVVFQLNPLDWIEKNISNKKLIACGEAIKIKNEWWNRLGISKVYDENTAIELDEYEALNCGIIAGDHNTIQKISSEIYDSTINQDINFEIPDQPAFNLIVRKKLSEETLFAGIDDAWVANLNIILSLSHNFDNYLLSKKPYIDENGVFRNSNNEIISIAHQYNRSIDLNNIVGKKYATNK